MKTRVTELLGIEYPILCGGMMRLAFPELCAAISEAGGLGSLTAAHYKSKEDLITAIREVRKLTSKPFWVNITIVPAVTVGEDLHRAYLDAVIEEKVPAIELSGMPIDRFANGEYLDKLKEADIKLIHKVGSVQHARHAEKVGYDAIIAAGVEEGGHPHQDNVATTVLTPRMADSIGIPVITAGGMVDGRGLAAALSLGAEGIMMATRFICVDECSAHPDVKQAIIDRQEYETRLYGTTIGLQGRALFNESIQEVLKIEEEKGGFEEIFPHITGALGPQVWERGKTDKGAINVGQSIGLVYDVVPCRTLLTRMVDDAKGILDRARGVF